MFAPTPLWDRPAKRGRGRRTRAAARDPARDAGEPAFGAGVIGASTAAEPADAAYETQPFTYRSIRDELPPRGVPTGAIVAGLVAVAAVGALGWYMARPHETSVAELTPGVPGTAELALAGSPLASPTPAAAPPVAPPAATPPASATPAGPTAAAARPAAAAAAHNRTASTRRAPAARVRPAPASGALEAGVDAGVTAPVVVPPSPSPSVTGPAVSTPPEVIAPSLDPVRPQATPQPGQTSPNPPIGDATTP